MNTQEKAVLESLLAKLSSLRKTLSDEERAILDQFIVIDFSSETTLHAQEVGAAEVGAAAVGAAEVGAAEVGALTDDEVTLHSFDVGGKVAIDSFSIDIDPETGKYVIGPY